MKVLTITSHRSTIGAAMPQPKLTVKLSGGKEDAGTVLFGDFRDFCGSLALCLRKVEGVVARDAKLRYRILDLKSGSIAMTLEPETAEDGQIAAEVVKLFAETVYKLEVGEPIDPRFTRDDLQAFRRLAEPLNRRLSEVRVADTDITSQFIANVDKIIGASIPSDGSVSGRLERLNLHNRNEFALYLPIGGFVVTCIFPEQLLSQVIAAIRQTVTVHGTLFFRPDSPFPDRVHVRSMEIHPPDEDLPTLGELRGLLKGSLGDQTSVEFVHSIRDEQAS
jgi:hypothetical protein